MRCPFCGHEDTQVKDSRPTDDNSAIRRRRYCPSCGSRFTTFERVQLRELTVVKKNGQRVPFDRDKLARSIQVACRKRPVDPERIERVVNGIVRRLESSGESEIPSTQIGELVMDALRALDPVAYVRFASVYRNFREAKDFEEFISRSRRDQPQGLTRMMRAALALARRSLGRTWPNPAVGCVIVKDGRVVAPRPHAGRRPPARRSRRARRRPAKPRAAPRSTSRSSPARTHGSTPPCADALVAAGVGARRLGAWRIPIPRVNGQGHATAARSGHRRRGGRGRGARRPRSMPASCCGCSAGRPLFTSSLRPRSTGASPPHRARANGSPAKPRAPTAIACAPPMTPSWSAPARSRPTIPSSPAGCRASAPIRRCGSCSIRRRGLAETSKLAKTARQVPVWLLCTSAARRRPAREALQRGGR